MLRHESRDLHGFVRYGGSSTEEKIIRNILHKLQAFRVVQLALVLRQFRRIMAMIALCIEVCIHLERIHSRARVEVEVTQALPFAPPCEPLANCTVPAGRPKLNQLHDNWLLNCAGNTQIHLWELIGEHRPNVLMSGHSGIEGGLGCVCLPSY